MLLRAAFMPPAAGEEKRAVCGQCRDFTLARPLRVQEIASLAVLVCLMLNEDESKLILFFTDAAARSPSWD